MLRKLALSMFLIGGIVAPAQVSNPSIVPVSVAPSICPLLPAYLYQAGSTLYISGPGNTCVALGSGGGGSGTVTSFSAGNLSPLFTSSVATPTTTPALTFSLSNAAQNSVFAGPASGGAGAPSYQTAPTFSAANLTGLPLAGLATQAADTMVANMTAGTAAPTAVAIPTTAHGVWLGEGTATAPGITAAGALGTFLGGAGGSADPTFNALSAINPQTATYQVLAGDFQAYKTISVASGTFTITLVASGSQPAAGQYINVLNYGSGVVTVARSGQNINGGTTSLTLNAGSATNPTDATIWSDGTNYFASVDEDNSNTVSSSTLTSNVIPKATGANAIGNSSITDNATTVTTTDTGGYVAPVFVANGTTAGFIDYPQGSTSAAVSPCNTANSICWQAPTSVTAQLRVFAGSPATGFPLYTNSSGTMTETITGVNGTLNSGVGLLGTLAVNTVLSSTVAAYAGHFTNLQVVTAVGGTCTTLPQFNVFDGTSNVGSTVTANASTQTKGTGNSTAQTLTFAAGDVIGIYISTAGGTCVANDFIVSAQYSTP